MCLYIHVFVKIYTVTMACFTDLYCSNLTIINLFSILAYLIYYFLFSFLVNEEIFNNCRKYK